MGPPKDGWAITKLVALGMAPIDGVIDRRLGARVSDEQRGLPEERKERQYLKTYLKLSINVYYLNKESGIRTAF
jgi:hypothetical protein